MKEKERGEAREQIVFQIDLEELQEIAMKQYGRILTSEEIEAFDNMTPVGLHDWIGWAIEAAQVEPGPE